MGFTYFMCSRGRSSAVAVAIALAFACFILGASHDARASANFPGEVDKHLSLTKPVEQIAGPPGMGCLLCHTVASGGFGTNNAFGTMLRESGAFGGDVATAGPALDKVAEEDPRAIADLANGVDPNSDSLALNHDPVPEFGCSASPPAVDGVRRSAPSISALLAGLLALGLAGRCRAKARAPGCEGHGAP